MFKLNQLMKQVQSTGFFKCKSSFAMWISYGTCVVLDGDSLKLFFVNVFFLL